MEKQEIVGVKFENNEKIYSFDPQGLNLQKNDKVIVQTSQGLSLGTVYAPNTVNVEENLVEPLKKVIRIASERDLETIERLKGKEKHAYKEAEEQSNQLKLNMKIIGAEYTFDESKVTITFTSENRVDFRELVKNLASDLHTRIELKQVGIRDEAKIIGGIGPCGQELCCSKFLKDFNKVSIKMAKNQGIALNPNNINGACGRLKCCLAYENDSYIEMINSMPRLNSQVKTVDGEGIVVYNNLLKKLVTVKIQKADGSFNTFDYPLEQITVIENKQINNNKDNNINKENNIKKDNQHNEKQIKDSESQGQNDR